MGKLGCRDTSCASVFKERKKNQGWLKCDLALCGCAGLFVCPHAHRLNRITFLTALWEQTALLLGEKAGWRIERAIVICGYFPPLTRSTICRARRLFENAGIVRTIRDNETKQTTFCCASECPSVFVCMSVSVTVCLSVFTFFLRFFTGHVIL